MQITRGLVSMFKSLLKQLNESGPDNEDWNLAYRLTNQLLVNYKKLLQEETSDESSFFNEKDHENIRKAIEIQRKIIIKVEKMREDIN
jgi:hypothetical protein